MLDATVTIINISQNNCPEINLGQGYEEAVDKTRTTKKQKSR